MSNDIPKYVRPIEDETDQELLDAGWEFAGTSLFWHPQIPYKFFTKEKAQEEYMGYYCSGCGSCGESGCCPPAKCKCSFHEVYTKDYESLAESYDELWDIAEQMFLHLTDYTLMGNEMNQGYDETVKKFLTRLTTETGKFTLPLSIEGKFKPTPQRLNELSEQSMEFLANATEEQLGDFVE